VKRLKLALLAGIAAGVPLPRPPGKAVQVVCPEMDQIQMVDVG
jgi:hypothetical protein